MSDIIKKNFNIIKLDGTLFEYEGEYYRPTISGSSDILSILGGRQEIALTRLDMEATEKMLKEKEIKCK